MCRKPAACATYVEFKLADATEQLSLVGVGTLQSALPGQLAPDFLLVFHSDSSAAVQCSALPGQLAPDFLLVLHSDSSAAVQCSALPGQLALDFLLVLHSDSSTTVQCSALPGQLVRVRGGVDLVQPVLQQAALVGATQQSVVQTGVGLIQ